MMDQIMMVSRVSLLLLVTGLFAGMWSSDRADEWSVAERRLTRQAYSSSVVMQPSVRPNQTAVRLVTRHQDERPRSSIPLPQGIAAGTYLIVDGRGRTETRVVSAAEALMTGWPGQRTCLVCLQRCRRQAGSSSVPRWCKADSGICCMVRVLKCLASSRDTSCRLFRPRRR